MGFVQAERLDTDGPVNVTRIQGDKLMVCVVDDGTEHAIIVSEFNAARVIGMLAFMIRMELTAALGKAIKL